MKRFLLTIAIALLTGNLTAEPETFQPSPYYDDKSIPREELVILKAALPIQAAAAEQKLSTIKNHLAEMRKYGYYLADCLQKRLEISARLVDFIKLKISEPQPDSLLFARRGIRELQIFINYFEQEIRRYRDSKNDGKGTVLSIQDFGAKGDGVTDDSDAFNKALAQIKKQPGNVTLRLPKGRYLINKITSIKNGESVPDMFAASPRQVPFWITLKQHLLLAGLTDFTLVGEPGTEVIFGDIMTPGMHIIACRNVTVKDVAFDYVDKPFTQGTIEQVNSTDNFIIWRKDKGFPSPLTERFLKAVPPCCQVHRPEDGKLIRGASGKFTGKIEELADDLYKIYLVRAFSRTLTEGLEPKLKFIIPARYNNIGMLSIMDSVSCTLNAVTIYSSPSAALAYGKSSGGNFIDCVITPRAGNVISTNADGLHCWNNKGIGPYVSGCNFSSMGDDAFNVYYRGQYIADCGEKDLVVMAGEDPGTTLAAVSPTTGQVKMEETIADVKSASWRNRSLAKLTFQRALPSGIVSYESLGLNPYSKETIAEKNTGGKPIGAEPDVIFAFERSGIGTIISGNNFFNNRNNGIVLQSTSAIIENNCIENVSIGIRLGSFLTWKEGPPPYNVVIRNNQIKDVAGGINCGYQLKSNTNADSRPMQNLVIANNVFSGCHVVLNLDNIEGLILKDNRINSAPPVNASIIFNNIGNTDGNNNSIDGKPLSWSDIQTTEKTDKVSIRLK